MGGKKTRILEEQQKGRHRWEEEGRQVRRANGRAREEGLRCEDLEKA